MSVGVLNYKDFISTGTRKRLCGLSCMNMSTALPEDISKKTLFSFVVYKPDYACRELNDLIADPDASLTAKG